MQAVSNFDLFTLDDVDTAFANSIQLKYQQHYQLAGANIVYIVLFLWIDRIPLQKVGYATAHL